MNRDFLGAKRRSKGRRSGRGCFFFSVLVTGTLLARLVGDSAVLELRNRFTRSVRIFSSIFAVWETERERENTE